MKLTLEDIRAVTSGVEDIKFVDEKYYFYRFNAAETENVKHPFVFATAGVQMKFKTDGDLLRLGVYTKKALATRSFFAFDVFVDGKLCGSIQNVADTECVGAYSEKEYPLGSFDGEFRLGKGEKSVRIVFPHSLVACVEEIEIENATYVAPEKNEKTILYYGDSITQGFDALHPSATYAVKTADALGAEIVNKAIGGAGFSPSFAHLPRNIKADLVVVAYGTNDWGGLAIDTIRNNAEGFLEGIKANHAGIPVYVITPIWRADWQETKKGGEFFDVENAIKEIFGKEENITVISGFDLVAHDTNLFGDLRLHPNDKGFEYYAENLLKELNG